VVIGELIYTYIYIYIHIYIYKYLSFLLIEELLTLDADEGLEFEWCGLRIPGLM
jgi:hypothetical protein